MTEHTTLTGANSRIRKLERKQRNLQHNFDAMAAGNRTRIHQYEAEIKRLREELKSRTIRRTITEAEYREGTGRFPAFTKLGFDTALKMLDVDVVPDPEPTNAEKLRNDLRTIPISSGFFITQDASEVLAKILDERGWAKEAESGDREDA